ncbi:sugar ABC transporter substrate-binding protein [Candidatus Atribacteria bacterium 1244-E10-H5-B2]|nr:MAG: sugar ABC transporter substrate-binding protein [Candidatus Atribacteria bacterium 1244-E10-H5-B2]
MRSNLKNHLTFLVVFLSLVIFLSGVVVEAKTYNYYVVSHGGPGDPFWGVVMKGMKEGAEAITKGTDDTINAIYAGPAKYSVEELVNMLNSAIATKPDGIVVTITDPAALDTPLRKAIAAGIPVIAINVPDPRPEAERIPYLFYVGGDEYLSGKKAAQRILAVRKPERAVVTIHEIGHIGLEYRAKGFIEVMTANGVPAEKLATYLDPTQAIEILKGYFAKNPDIDALFSLGSIDSAYVITFLKEQGLDGKVIHGAFDVSDEVVHSIKEGTTLFTISQQQYLQGYLPMQFLYLLNKYKFLPANDVLTGPGFIDASNVASVEKLVEQKFW